MRAIRNPQSSFPRKEPNFQSNAFSDSVTVVLVEPGESLNIGSVARAMKNLGFSKLRLVAPRNYSEEKARATACWAGDLLEQMRHYEDLSSALEDMQEVVGFTAREGKNRLGNQLLHEWKGSWFQESPHPTALMFGPEDTGLRNEHLAFCSAFVRIPSAAENPAYNLAQAVLLALYEIMREVPFEANAEKQEYPSWNEFYQLERQLDELMEGSGFARAGTPEAMPSLVKNLMRRTRPDKREMSILLGLFGKLSREIARLKGTGSSS